VSGEFDGHRQFHDTDSLNTSYSIQYSATYTIHQLFGTFDSLGSTIFCERAVYREKVFVLAPEVRPQQPPIGSPTKEHWPIIFYTSTPSAIVGGGEGSNQSYRNRWLVVVATVQRDLGRESIFVISFLPLLDFLVEKKNR
jgi:hypothetical protein